MTLALEDPPSMQNHNPLCLGKPTGVILRFDTQRLGSHFRFHHVSGEHWLVEEHITDFVHASVPGEWSKARSEIGPDGKVTAFHVVFETSVEGDVGWSKFIRID